MRKPNSLFYRWWNSYTGRRIVGATYSIGASVVILGALFKILHLPMGDIVLGVGMCVESFIFALGSFDKPYREYDWSRIFDFKAETDQKISANNLGAIGGVSTGNAIPQSTSETHTASAPYQNNGTQTQIQPTHSHTLSEEEVQKLNESISNLAQTANSLQTLTDLTLSTNSFAESIAEAAQTATHFKESQQHLNQQAQTLATAYQEVNGEMHTVIHQTKNYATSINHINSNIDQLQTNYTQQAKEVQQQTSTLHQQTEKTHQLNTHLDDIKTQVEQLKATTQQTLQENQKYQAATQQLTQQVEDLNAIYGNMLNALS